MYAKIFDQIFESSISTDYLTRHVFMDFLVLADVDGVVDMTFDSIQRRTNVPIEMLRTALEKLTAPDPHSRSREEEGRRMVLVDSHRDWGWRIVNYEHYRTLRTAEDRRTYFRDYNQKRPVRQSKLHNRKERQHTATHGNTVLPVLPKQCKFEQIESEDQAKIKRMYEKFPVGFPHVQPHLGNQQEIVASPIESTATPRQHTATHGNTDNTEAEAEADKSSALLPEVFTKPETDGDSAPKNGAAASLSLRWFETLFWPSVWLKTGKGAARKQWIAKKIRTIELAQKISTAARDQGPSIIAHAANNGHSVLHPSTWLSQERWEDELLPGNNLATTPSRPQHSPSSAYDQKLNERLQHAATLRQERSGPG
jgi:hypothetical protein